MPPKKCPCASGLSTARCCGWNLADAGAQQAHRHLVPLETQAAAALRAGDLETAASLAMDVLELAPGRVEALGVLYQVRKSQGAGGEALIRRLVALQPNSFWAINEIVLLLLGKGAAAEAEIHARNGIRVAPDLTQAHYLLAMVLTELYRPAFGEFHYHRALELSGARDPALLTNLALCLKNQGKMEAARALYHEALAAAPANLHGWMGLARLEEADRQLPAARAALDRAEALAPGSALVQLQRAVVMGREGRAAEAVALLDSQASGDKSGDKNGDKNLGPSEWLEKGRLLDRLGRYEEAFAAFDAGKTLLREATGQTYLAAEAETVIARQKGFYTARRLRTLPRAGVRQDGAQPLFVLGFPRSGTTLLEQTLSAHPRITAGDELPLIHEISRLMPRMLDSPLSYPDALAELWMADHHGDLDNLRDHYLRRVAQLGIPVAGKAWFTDKMPLNETDMGLISLLFPASPMLHLLRHPLDVMLSVYSNLLTHGFYCAYSLESAARHYVLVMDLVAHYRRELDIRYMPVRYEDMVRDQRRVIQEVLDFIGEEFDPACLAFHENRRYARTASYAQVSEKLYDRSCFRYRHYLPQLAPIIPILRETIERLGYEI